MPRRSLEIDIQSKVTEHATYSGLVPFRLNVLGRKGWPDYGYGYRGRMCFIEYKRPGEKPEPLQAYVHQILREEGFYVFVVDNADYGITLLDTWKRDIDENLNVEAVRQSDYRNQRPGPHLRVPSRR